MPVDAQWLRKLRDVVGVDSYDDGVDDPARAEQLRLWEAQDDEWGIPDPVVVRDTSVPGPHGPVPVRVYESTAGVPTAAVLWMHGGGYVGGDLDMPEGNAVSAELAARTGATVVSVDYRLAVDGVHYPVPLDDVIAAWEWLVEHRTALRVSGPLLIGGASAGAGLAAGAVARLRDEGGHQADGVLLAYPGLHFPLPPLAEAVSDEMRDFPKVARLQYETAVALQRNWAGRLHDMPVYAVPGNGSLADLPPVHVVICEYDDLRSSGEVLVAQLEEAGVEVSVHRAEGMLHGHLNRVPGPTFPEVGRSIDFFAEGIRTTTSRS